MRCPGCHADVTKKAKFCSQCGGNLKLADENQASAPSPDSLPQEDLTAINAGESAMKPPSGFRRTLSTEMVTRQAELRTLLKLSSLVENRTYKPGEIMIHKGEKRRDLYFMTEGDVEISRKEGGGETLSLTKWSPQTFSGISPFCPVHLERLLS